MPGTRQIVDVDDMAATLRRRHIVDMDEASIGAANDKVHMFRKGASKVFSECSTADSAAEGTVMSAQEPTSPTSALSASPSSSSRAKVDCPKVRGSTQGVSAVSWDEARLRVEAGEGDRGMRGVVVVESASLPTILQLTAILKRAFNDSPLGLAVSLETPFLLQPRPDDTGRRSAGIPFRFRMLPGHSKNASARFRTLPDTSKDKLLPHLVSELKAVLEEFVPQCSVQGSLLTEDGWLEDCPTKAAHRIVKSATANF